jgi:hypothetical protein
MRPVSWQLIGYALACVVTPFAWGLVIVWVSNRMDRRLVRRRPHGGRRKLPRPIEYHI